MKLKKKYKILLIVIISLSLLSLIGFGIYKWCFPKKTEEPPTVTNVATVTNKIEGFDYTLDDRDTVIFSDLFKTLKENLEGETIDEEAYAETLAKLFIIDLFTIDNKTSKYDIGGLEYLYSGARESFRAKVLDSIYKTVEDNSYKTRTQKLPIVKTVEIEAKEPTTYEIEKEKKEAYQVTLTWTYEENLGYDTKAKVTLMKEENKWTIVNYTPTK